MLEISVHLTITNLSQWILNKRYRNIFGYFGCFKYFYDDCTRQVYKYAELALRYVILEQILLCRCGWNQSLLRKLVLEIWPSKTIEPYDMSHNILRTWLNCLLCLLFLSSKCCLHLFTTDCGSHEFTKLRLKKLGHRIFFLIKNIEVLSIDRHIYPLDIFRGMSWSNVIFIIPSFL